MTQLRQNISAFFRDQRTFRVVDGFLLLLPWILCVLLFWSSIDEILFWLSVVGLAVMIAMLCLNRPWFSFRYLVSAAGLSLIFRSPILFFAVAFYCAYCVAAIFKRDVGFSFRFTPTYTYRDDGGYHSATFVEMILHKLKKD